MSKMKALSLILTCIISLSAITMANAPPPAVPVVYIDPAETTGPDPCNSFTVDVNIQDVVDLYGWQIKIEFNPHILEATSGMEGPFLKGQPGGAAFMVWFYSDYVEAVCSLVGSYPGVSGSGTLFNVTFHVKDLGTSALDIFYSELRDSDLHAISHEVTDGYFSNTPEANLVKKSAWPEHHHFDVSTQLARDGNSNQTLTGKVKNLGLPDLDLYVYVSFEVVRDDGVIAVLTSDVVIVAPGTEVDLSADFGPLSNLDAGKHYVSASCWFSYTGTYYTQGKKIKTFSFSVVQ